MSAPGITPGPWKAETNLGCKRISAKPYAGLQHKQAKRFEVACTPGLWDEAEDKANAKAIAAVPDMIEALQIAATEPERVSLYDEEGAEGWRWTHPITGAEYTAIGDWSDPPPPPPPVEDALRKAGVL